MNILEAQVIQGARVVWVVIVITQLVLIYKRHRIGCSELVAEFVFVEIFNETKVTDVRLLSFYYLAGILFTISLLNLIIIGTLIILNFFSIARYHLFELGVFIIIPWISFLTLNLSLLVLRMLANQIILLILKATSLIIDLLWMSLNAVDCFILNSKGGLFDYILLFM